jgi:myb proto-oncogene protein
VCHRGNWSLEEEFLLAQCHAVVGSHWSKMTKRLPGRTENSIKNFWNATLRSK